MGEHIIPGWKTIRIIGKGSSGCVYEIEKEDEFGGSIRSALKVISIPESSAEIEAYRDDGYDDASLTALYRSRVEDITSEFRLMNKLKGCSNIVSYEDHLIVRHDDDIGYDILIRMELLTPLPKYFDQHYSGTEADENVICKLGVDMSRALERCGRHRIIHRDIKPQNIFVNEEGDFKLGDFGIAKTSDHTTKATKTGTYGYMAPEVYWGRPYNASVDIYSLGVVLYWTLNERRGPFLPLPPETPKPAQATEALERRMHGDPLPAPKHGSEELQRIVLKACAFDPKDRYQSPTEMRHDLEKLLGITDNSVVSVPRNLHTQNTDRVEYQSAGEKTVSAYRCATEKRDISDADTTIGVFPIKPVDTRAPEIVKKTEEIKPAEAPVRSAEEQKTKKAKNRNGKKKNKLMLILSAAALFIAAAVIVLIVVLGGRGKSASKQAEATAASVEEPAVEPTLESARKPTEEPTLKSTPEPTDAPTSKPTDEPTPEPAFFNVSEGNIITFGTYEQDNNINNGKENIEWIVLAVEEDKAFLVSLYALDSQRYNTSLTNVTWETCTLRSWLNETFFNTAFSAEEQAAICSTTVKDEKNPEYGTLPGNDTIDKVFLLSVSEASRYFSSDIDRRCDGTAYCYARGADEAGKCWWWLRTPGYGTDYAVRVLNGGPIGNHGNEVNHVGCAVRPALWLSLEQVSLYTVSATPKPTPTP